MLAISGMAALGLTSGCVVEGPPPPPPRVAVVGFVPDYCFWDGYEYIGWDADYYYYWGPSRVWIVCDPVRVHRINVWLDNHPNWHERVRHNEQFRFGEKAPQQQLQPMRPPPGRRDRAHDHRH